MTLFHYQSLILCADCPVNFENQNYTIITSKCKGPNYPPKICCDALKEFACPFADEVSDLKTDCATTMFSYINIYGKYPPGLFASQCREQKEGLKCADAEPPKPSTASARMAASATRLALAAAFLLLSLHFFWAAAHQLTTCNPIRFKYFLLYSTNLYTNSFT